MGADAAQPVAGAPAPELGRTAGADEVAGLDALETRQVRRSPLGRRLWSSFWPKLLAVVIGIGVWQAVTLAELWPDWVLPGPILVFERLAAEIGGIELWRAVGITMQRAAWGF